MNKVWWNQVTNAVQYVHNIKDTLLDEKSILIKHTSNIPWKDEFRSSIIEYVKQQNSEKKFEMLSSISNPGEYLLNEFCKKEKRAKYRPIIGYPKFLAESNDIVIHDRYFWVDVDDSVNLESWEIFTSEYIKERGQKNKAVFIFDMHSDEHVVAKKGIKQFSLDDFIGEYDRIVFSVLASSSIKEKSFMKTYLAEMVSNIAGNDIELCSECIKNYKDFLQNPTTCIDIICNNFRRSDGSNFEYDKSDENVKHLIWLSQIKTIYPYIEEYREKFVQKYFDYIKSQLPITTCYDEIYNDPKDVELGTLKYMADNKFISLSMQEYEILKKFKDARNKLSHLSCLSIDEIQEII